MDAMKIKTEFMRKLIGKFIKRKLKKTMDCNCGIFINDVDITNTNGRIRAHLDIELDADESEVAKLLANL